MERKDLTIGLCDLTPEDHICFLFDSEEEHRAVIGEFVKIGIEKNEKVIYVRDARSESAILEYTERAGMDAHASVAKGQVEISGFARAYMYGSEFNPERMIRLVRNETAMALAQGWSGLRLTMEMTWLLARRPGSHRIIEYEAMANRFIYGSKRLAMCQYDRRYLKPELLLYALSTHPAVVVGGRVHDNPYYRIPPPFMKRETAGAILSHWLADIDDYNRPSVARSRTAGSESLLDF